MVPLTIPITREMRSPASDSRSGRMIGMPPATAASKSRSTPLRSAASNSSAPCLASSSLLPVITGLPAFSAVRMRSRAGSTPPISSTTRSISGSSTIDLASSVSRSGGRLIGRGLVRSRTAMRATSRWSPVRAAMVACWAPISSTRGAPTLPHPSTPTLTWFTVHMVEARSSPTPSRFTAGRRGGAGRRRSRGGPPRGHDPRRRTRPRGAGPCCSWTPSSGRRHP